MFNEKLKKRIKELERDRDEYKQMYWDECKKRTDDYSDLMNKISELLKGYESIDKYKLFEMNFVDCSYAHFNNQGYLMTTEQIPTFEEFFKKFIDTLPFDKRPDFYNEIKPIIRKYITSERELFNLDICMKDKISIYKPKLKKSDKK